MTCPVSVQSLVNKDLVTMATDQLTYFIQNITSSVSVSMTTTLFYPLIGFNSFWFATLRSSEHSTMSSDTGRPVWPHPQGHTSQILIIFSSFFAYYWCNTQYQGHTLFINTGNLLKKSYTNYILTDID